MTAVLEWDDRYLVGHKAMDDTHREFAVLVNAMLVADDELIAPALEAFARHAEEHFGAEERLMDRYGFPARECHAEEHEKVLSSVREVRELVAAGDVDVGRELAQALADWFPGHSAYMDSALATWIVKKLTNGAPVVLRRTGRASASTVDIPTLERIDVADGSRRPMPSAGRATTRNPT